MNYVRLGSDYFIPEMDNCTGILYIYTGKWCASRKNVYFIPGKWSVLTPGKCFSSSGKMVCPSGKKYFLDPPKPFYTCPPENWFILYRKLCILYREMVHMIPGNGLFYTGKWFILYWQDDSFYSGRRFILHQEIDYFRPENGSFYTKHLFLIAPEKCFVCVM